jgi:hypothetical protein
MVPVKQFRCVCCRKAFTRKTEAKRLSYCSAECSRKVQRHKGKVSRRLRIESGPVHYIPLGRLIRRDKGICHICGEAVRRDVDVQHDMAPSRDHVLPLAKGGTHTWGNVRLAHRICNSLKRDTVPASGVDMQRWLFA